MKENRQGIRSGVWLVLVLVLVGLLLLPIPAGRQTVRAQGNCDLSTADAFIERADAAYDAGDYEAAIQDYACAIALEPRNIHALNSRGNAYFTLERYESAIADYDRVIEVETGNADYAYYNRGSAYLQLDNYEQAEADLNRALELNPAYGIAYNNRGNVYYDQGDYVRAIADYTRAVDLPDGESYIPYYNRGIAYYELGDYDQSLADLSQALRINPDYAIAFLARAGTYQVTDRAKSHADFLTWIELNQQEVVEETDITTLDDRPLTMTAGRVYRLSFRAGIGQVLNIAARTQGNDELDPLVVLLDPADNPIASDDDSGVNLDAVIAGFTVPDAGLYTLVVGTAGGGTEGDLLLTLTVDGEAAKIFEVYTLEIDQPARIYTTADETLNLRSGPGLNFDVLAKLEKDTVVTLLEGPRKGDGYVWWRLRTADGQEGWAVERVDEIQTLQPPLVIGGQATVFPLSGDRLNVREAPGRANPIVTQLDPGVIVTVLEGPQLVDDLRWWKLRLPDGQEGWAVDEVEGEQTLIGRAASAAEPAG